MTMRTAICMCHDVKYVNMMLAEYLCAKWWVDKTKTYVMNTPHEGAVGSLKGVQKAILLTAGNNTDLNKWLETLSNALEPGSELHVVFGGKAEDVQDTTIRRSILLNGFTDVPQQAEVIPLSVNSVDCLSMFGSGSSHIIIYNAKKPNWQSGAKQAVKLKLKKSSKGKNLDSGKGDRGDSKLGEENAATSEEVLKVWRFNGADEELIDDEDLVDDIQIPAVPVKAEGGCETKKKACKNCSCGRAEMEAEQEAQEKRGIPGAQLTKDQLENPQSACGNCALGDAFRCETCPYKGMPRFKLGEKIQLPTNMLEADA